METRQIALTNSLTISYIDTRVGEHALLLLHGWGLTSKVYSRTIMRIASHYRVVAPDLPSFGRSSAPLQKNWTYIDYAKAIGDFAERVTGVPAVVVGHSFGGGVGIVLATLRPELVHTLVVVDGACIPLHSSVITLAIRRVMEVIIQGLSFSTISPNISIISAFAYNCTKHALPIWRALRLPIHVDLREKASNLSMSKVVIWATKDMMIPITKGRETARIMGVDLVSSPPNRYHDWCITHPDEFSQILLANLKQVG